MSKKAKYTLAKIVVALCIVLCLVLTVFELGVSYRTFKALEVDGTEYSVAEYNWLYTNSVYEIYNNYYQSYGQLAVYFFNPQGNLSEAVRNEETGETWADYLKEYTNNTFVEMTKLYDEGKAAGYELADEYIEGINAEWEAMKETATENGYSVGDYAELSYGRGVNEKVFKEMYERYYYAFSYAEKVATDEVITAEEIDAYYAENSELFDSVSYNYYFASSSAAEGQSAEDAKAAAKADAEAVLSGSKEATLSATRYAEKGSINPAFAEWLFDEARVSGDKELFETESGCYVIEFVEANDLHYNTVNVRHILVSPEDSSSDAAWEAALELAEKYEAEWKELGETEENFAIMAAKYSTDANSSANGGLFNNIRKGQMVTEFEDWCFDSARKAGDSEIIKSSYGYHVMYFSGVAEEYYTYAIDSAVRSERLNAYLDGIIEGVEASELFGIKLAAKHFA